MHLTQDLVAEIELLDLYDLDSLQRGIKVHSSASEALIAAAQRLYSKGLVDHMDGGFLTPLGREAAEHVQAALRIVASEPSPGMDGPLVA